MSSLLVYGIVGIDHERPFGRGLEGQAVRGVPGGDLLAVVGEHDGPSNKPTIAAARRYERIVRLLMDGGPILPARFGSVVADDAAAAALLRERQADLLRRLRRVDGAVEIALSACMPAGGAPAFPTGQPQSGTSYLRARLELRDRAERVARQLGPLAEIARGVRRALTPRDDVLVRNAYLVERGRMDDFISLVQELDLGVGDADLLCTGPWPPYSFAQGEPV